MKRLFLAIMLCSASLTFAQTSPWRMPAKQVDVRTNTFSVLGQTNSVTYAPTNSLQAVLEWMDDNWLGFSTNGWVTLAPSNGTLQATLNWIDSNWGIINTNGWTYLSPTSATIQATFDWLDDYTMPGTNIQNATYNPTNRTWEGLAASSNTMPGTNIVGATYDPSNLTWTVNGAQGVELIRFTRSVTQALVKLTVPYMNSKFNVVHGGAYTNLFAPLDTTNHFIFYPAAGQSYILGAAIQLTSLTGSGDVNDYFTYVYKNGAIYAGTSLGQQDAPGEKFNFLYEIPVINATSGDYYEIRFHLDSSTCQLDLLTSIYLKPLTVD